jgi:type I restriction enzyme S subunit
VEQSHFKPLTVTPRQCRRAERPDSAIGHTRQADQNWREDNPDVEPASVLLEKIKAERKKIPKARKTVYLEKGEIPFNIPKSWVWTKLGGLCAVQTGRKDANYGTENGEYNFYTCAQIPIKSPGYSFEGESIILPGNGANVGLVTYVNEKFEAYQRTYVLNGFTNLFPLYVKTALEALWKDNLGKQYGSAINYIKLGNITEFKFPIPPLEEQEAIVSIVNQLFAEVEQLQVATKERVRLKEDYVTSALRQLTEGDTAREWAALQPHFKTFFTEPATIKTLRESILQLAVQGKLTRAWRGRHPELVEREHSAQALLERIKAEKAQLIADKKIKKEKPLPAIKEDEIPYELPEGWEWCRLGDLITFLNGYAYKSSTYVEDSKFQVIRLGNVKNDRFLIDVKQAYVPETIGSQTLDYKLYEGDILTTLTGTKNKRDYCFTCMVKPEHLGSRTLLLNQRVGCIRPIDFDSSELMNKFLKSNVELDQLFATESGTANQGNIGSTAFKNLIYPLPPKEEQKAIVQQVNALMALCDQLENEIATRTTTLEDWMKSWVGGLVISRLYKDE